jgi:hypothetical protein
VRSNTVIDETPSEKRTPDEAVHGDHVQGPGPETDAARAQIDETPDFAEPVNASDHVNSAEHDGTVEHVVPANEEEVRPVEPPELVNPPEPVAPARLAAPAVVAVPAAASVDEVDNVAVLPPVAETAAVAPVATPAQTYYVEAPVPPRKKGNRGAGTLIALLSTVFFAALFAVAVAIIRSARGGAFAFDFFAESPYYVPVIFFAVGFIILVLLVNRAGWWVHVFGSIFVGLFVYFGTIGTLLLIGGVLSLTPSQGGVLFASLLSNPFEIAAALIAREVALWMGFAISARGRRVKARNIEARAAYDSEVAEKRAEYDRSNAAVPA